MRRILLALLCHAFLFTLPSPATHTLPSCELDEKSVISRTPTGIAQVSNLGGVEIECRIPARPFPNKPGRVASAFEPKQTPTKSWRAVRRLVPSEVKVSGGGSAAGAEWVGFVFLIPLDAAEQEIEAQRIYCQNTRSAVPGRTGKAESRRAGGYRESESPGRSESGWPLSSGMPGSGRRTCRWARDR